MKGISHVSHYPTKESMSRAILHHYWFYPLGFVCIVSVQVRNWPHESGFFWPITIRIS